MKKSITVILLSLACAVACAFGLAACTDSGNAPSGEHVHSYHETVFEPTCSDIGYTEHKCECGESYKDNYEQRKPHTEVIDEGVEATCTTDGLTQGKHCSTCGSTLVEQSVIPKGHKVVADRAIKPTCTTDGKTEGSHCSECGEIIVAQTTIPSTGHEEVKDEAVDVTCTTDGKTEGSHCSKCGEIFVHQTTIPATGHVVNRLNFCEVCRENAATEGLRYTLNSDGQSYSLSYGVSANATEIYISSEYEGKPVTRIGNGVFSGYYKIESVYIPDTVTEIGNNAFMRCDRLVNITLPINLRSIGQMAFYGCRGLTSLTIPSTVTDIGRYALYGCDGLECNSYDNAKYLGNTDNPYMVLLRANNTDITSCKISDKTVFIHSTAFRSCRGLTAIEIPSSVVDIGAAAFSGCINLKSVIVHDTLKSIDDSAFGSCDGLEYNTFGGAEYLGDSENPYVVLVKASSEDIASLNISDKTKIIYYRAFAYCRNLTSIKIPSSVISIGSYAFYNCSGLVSVQISDSVTSIPQAAFEYCSKLENVTIPDTVKSIGTHAFYYSGLTSIYIPASVTNIASEAFGGCGGLLDITVDGGNLVYRSLGNCLIDVAKKELIRGCRNSVIPSDGSVTRIGSSAFYYCNGLTSIAIPNTVTYIGYRAFSYCGDLKSVTIPSSVTGIGDYAFNECGSLTSVFISASVTNISTNAFSDCGSLSSIEVDAENPVYHSANNCVIRTDLKMLVLGCIGSVIPSDGSVTVIGAYSFRGSGVKSVVIPDSVTTIQTSAFEDCESLTTVSIGESVKSIGYWAFRNCSALTSIYIPASVTNIDDAFVNCGGLLSIVVDRNNAFYHGAFDCLIETVSGKLILGCRRSDIPLDGSVTEIGNWAFYGCSGLTSVTIPASVTSIGFMAFRGCENLTSITFTGSVEQWKAIEKDNTWNDATGEYTVTCNDGVLTKKES